jgi:cell division protein FtsQ
VGSAQNIFSVSLGAVARRVESHPWIAKAEVHRRLPDAIHIQVTENVPAGAVLLESDEPGKSAFYLLNAEGVVFKRALVAELEGLPLITGLSRQEYRQARDESRGRLREALEVVRHYTAQAGRPKLGEVHVDPVEGVTLYTAGQAVQIRLGQGDASAKLRRLDRILGALAARGERPMAIRLDNARHPRRVTVQLAEAGAHGAHPRP